MIAQPARRRFELQDLRMALIVTRREVRDASRDWRIIIPIIILTLVFPGIATYTARALLDFTEQYGAELVTEQLVPFLLLVVGFFPMSFSLVIALETFVGEKERKSLEPLLATPLTNTQLYVGKMLAALIPPMLTSYLGIVVYVAGLSLTIGLSIRPTLLVQILMISTIQGVVMVSAAVIVSSQTTSVRAANLLASFIIVPVALLLQFEAVALFWGNEVGLWWLILALATTAVILMRMGVRIFNREDLLGQDIDQLRLRWMLANFWGRFTGKSDNGGRYPGPITWYRQTWGILRQLRLPALAMALGLGLAVTLGIYFYRLYMLPEAFQSQLGATDILANVGQLQDFFARLPAVIFIQNVRVVILSALLGIFTLGVADVIIFMLPWVLLTYVAGQVGAAGEQPLTFLMAAVLPHAILELPALLIAQAALLRWHTAVLARPENRTLGENWLLNAADFARVFLGLVLPLLALAAFVEANLTPQVIIAVYGG